MSLREQMEFKRRIDKAIEIAAKYGMVDGEHHKQWVIDEILCQLLGRHNHRQFLIENPDWDRGLAP